MKNKMYKYLYKRSKERVDSLLRTVLFYADRTLYNSTVEQEQEAILYDKGGLARKTIRATFINSEGWRLKAYKLIQRVDPEAVIPKKWTAINNISMIK